MAIDVHVGIQEEDAAAAAEVLRLIADQVEEDYRDGYDRRSGGNYYYTVTVVGEDDLPTYGVGSGERVREEWNDGRPLRP